MHLPSLMTTLAPANNILLLCHQNADPDSLGSAYALAKLIELKAPSKRVEIVTPGGVSKVGRRILQHIPMFTRDRPSLDDADMIVLVDINTLVQLGDFGTAIKESSKPFVLIDHHAPHEETVPFSTLNITDQNASSTCEIIHGFYAEADIEPDMSTAIALFLGIAYDTRHFSIAKSQTFRTVARLIDLGLVAEEVLPILAQSFDIPEKLARLKAAQRLQRTRLGEWLVVSSKVGSYISSAARALLVLGADAAVVGGERKGRVKISLRSTQRFYEQTHVHLGRGIAFPLGKLLHGMGGGHSTAAGVNGEGMIEDALKTCLELLREAVSHPCECDSKGYPQRAHHNKA